MGMWARTEPPSPCTRSAEMIVKLFLKQTNKRTPGENKTGPSQNAEQPEPPTGDAASTRSLEHVPSWNATHSDDSEVIVLRQKPARRREACICFMAVRLSLRVSWLNTKEVYFSITNSAAHDGGRLHGQTFRDQGCWGLRGVTWPPRWSQASAPRGQRRDERRARAGSQARKCVPFCSPGLLRVTQPQHPSHLPGRLETHVPAGKCVTTCWVPSTLHPSGQQTATSGAIANLKYAQPHPQEASPPMQCARSDHCPEPRVQGARLGLRLPHRQVQMWEAAESRQAGEFMQQRAQNVVRPS